VKKIIRIIFSPVLSIFESGTEAFVYNASHRIILVVMGCLFTALATLVFVLARGEDPGYLFPVLVFGGSGLLALLIGFVGSDRAVAKIWGSK